MNVWQISLVGPCRKSLCPNNAVKLFLSSSDHARVEHHSLEEPLQCSRSCLGPSGQNTTKQDSFLRVGEELGTLVLEKTGEKAVGSLTGLGALNDAVVEDGPEPDDVGEGLLSF
jgi:hypothetical protein